MDTKWQAIINTVGSIVYALSFWLLTVITTQCFDYGAVGMLTLSMSIGNVFFVVQTLDVRPLQAADVNFRYSPAEYRRLRYITVIAGLFLCVLLCLFLRYSFSTTVSILLFMLIRTTEAFSDVMFGDLQRLGKLEMAGYSFILRGIGITLLFLLGAVTFQRLNVSLSAAAAGVLLITLFFDLPRYRRRVDSSGKAEASMVVRLMRECIPLFLATVLPIVIIALPRLILERLYGTELLGIYGNLSTPTSVLTVIVPAVLTVLYPLLGRLTTKKDTLGILRVWGMTLLGTILFTGLCMLGVWLVGKPLLALLYTDRIVPSIPYLYGIFVAMLFYAFTMCNGTVLAIIHEGQLLTISVFLALILSLALSFPLVRAWGIGGAVAVLAISYGVQALVQAIWLLRLCLGKKGKANE